MSSKRKLDPFEWTAIMGTIILVYIFSKVVYVELLT